MMIKSFEEYQIDHGQLFESKAAFNAAVAMCKAHYETGWGENAEEWKGLVEDKTKEAIINLEHLEIEGLGTVTVEIEEEDA